MTIGVTYSFRGSCDSEKSFVMLGNLYDLLLFWLFGGLVIRNCQASLHGCGKDCGSGKTESF